MHNQKIDNKFRLFTKEVKLLDNEKTVSRTDTDGNILYFNHTFSKISGYKKENLSHVPHSLLRHPDMPKTIFYLVWKSLLAGYETDALVKNLTKDGNYYWQRIHFSIQKDNQNRTLSFLSEGQQASLLAITEVESIYKELLEIEKYNTANAINFFLDFLNSNNIATYNDYISRINQKRKQPTLFNYCIGFFF